MDQHELVRSFMEECKTYENNPLMYSWYVHGYFLPWLDYEREAGRLTNGKTQIYNIIFNEIYLGTA